MLSGRFLLWAVRSCAVLRIEHRKSPEFRKKLTPQGGPGAMSGASVSCFCVDITNTKRQVMRFSILFFIILMKSLGGGGEISFLWITIAWIPQAKSPMNPRNRMNPYRMKSRRVLPCTSLHPGFNSLAWSGSKKYVTCGKERIELICLYIYIYIYMCIEPLYKTHVYNVHKHLHDNLLKHLRCNNNQVASCLGSGILEIESHTVLCSVSQTKRIPTGTLTCLVGKSTTCRCMSHWTCWFSMSMIAY